MLSNELEVDKVNRLIQQSLPEEQKELVSDGYHTFKELYAHRVKLFVALCNQMKIVDEFTQCKHLQWTPPPPILYRAWKSKFHADGTMYDGWFIAWIWLEPWNTLTYHLPIEEWDNFMCPEVWHAPKWDWHTSDDVMNLLYKLTKQLWQL